MDLLKSRIVTLNANGDAIDHQAGSVLLLDGLTAGPSVDVTWIDAAGNEAGTVSGVLIGRKLHAGGVFAGYRLKGAAGAVCAIMIGPDTADASNMLTTSVVIGHVISDAGSVVEVANDVGNPLPVTSAITTVVTDTAAVAATAARSALLALNAARRMFRVRNAGPDPVAIGGAAVTFAEAAIVLQANDLWIESDAPGAAWSCICDAGKTASVKILVGA